jgi:CDP-glucose 4,6-dehydratase
LAAGERIVVRNPEAVRPWQHVLEPLSGYLWLAALLLRDGHRFDGPWNFGPTDQDGARPVRWVVERFLDEWGSGSWATLPKAGTQPHEAHRLSLDSTKARKELAWAPVWDARTAVRQTAAWYRDYCRDAAVARDLVRGQLRDYENDARAAGLLWAGEEEQPSGHATSRSDEVD